MFSIDDVIMISQNFSLFLYLHLHSFTYTSSMFQPLSLLSATCLWHGLYTKTKNGTTRLSNLGKCRERSWYAHSGVSKFACDTCRQECTRCYGIFPVGTKTLGCSHPSLRTVLGWHICDRGINCCCLIYYIRRVLVLVWVPRSGSTQTAQLLKSGGNCIMLVIFAKLY